MKAFVNKFKINAVKYDYVEFDSLSDLDKFLKETPENEVFKYGSLSSHSTDYSWAKCHNYSEAENLLMEGWNSMAKKLTKELKTKKIAANPKMKTKYVNSVCGFQAIVPAYLQGLPNSMVGVKMTPVKNKIVTITKDISYSAYYTVDKIVSESIKTLQIIQNLEANGYRCNIFVIDTAKRSYGKVKKGFIFKYKIKGANERLNISKLAFPLVHPSMLRRISFSVLEKYQGVSNENWEHTYGAPMDSEEVKQTLGANEVFLPKDIKDNVDEIQNVNDLRANY